MNCEPNMKQWLEGARALRERLLSDHARPRYHFACPEDDGTPGDPNGAFYADGRYHLMFLYHCCSDSFRYGHLSSPDLIHWERHPDALIPDSLDGGIFSGGAFLDDDGTAYLSYWALAEERSGRQSGIRLAYSRDRQNRYEKWEKFPEEAVEATAFGVRTVVDRDGVLRHLAAADPSNIWKKDGYYYMQAGNLPLLDAFGRQPDSDPYYRGDATDLYRSQDLRSWEYLHRFYSRRADNAWTDETEDDMCPSFLPLPPAAEGGAPTDRWLQLFISHNKGCQYYIGRYDRENDRFLPERHGRMSWLDNHYFAPEAVIAPDGRQIMWAWIKENREREAERFGWSGVYGVPRSLWLNEDGTLGIAPVEELKRLRCRAYGQIDGVFSRCCEAELIAEVGKGGRAGITFYRSEDGSAFSRFLYDEEAGELIYESHQPGSEPEKDVERAPFRLKEGEPLRMTVLIDGSVAEAFVNRRQAIGRRVYPMRGNEALAITAEGKVRVLEQKVWEMAPVNPY